MEEAEGRLEVEGASSDPLRERVPVLSVSQKLRPNIELDAMCVRPAPSSSRGLLAGGSIFLDASAINLMAIPVLTAKARPGPCFAYVYQHLIRTKPPRKQAETHERHTDPQ